MANILHTIYNTSTTLSAVVNSFTFDTDSHIQHHADLSTFGLSSDFTGATTIATVSANYEKGGLYRKNYSTATFAIIQTITGHDGTTLMVQSTSDLVGKTGWEGNGVYAGRYIVSITSATWLVMSGTPSGSPTINGSIQFSTSTIELTLSGTTPTLGMGPSWTILGNGYNSAGTVISVKDSTTLVVDSLPTNPTIGNLMTFRAPGVNAANTITVTSSAGLSTGFVASGNGFTLNQYITNINGNVLTMSAEPNVTTSALPAYNSSIVFSNVNATLYTIPASGSVSFNLDYTNTNGTINNTYASTLTVKVTQGTQKTLTVRNFVGINAAPVPPPPPTYTGNGGGRVDPTAPLWTNYGAGSGGIVTNGYSPISGITQAPGEQGRESMGRDSSVGTSIGSGSMGGSGFGSGGSNGNATCFVQGSLVTLADKTKIAIEDVKIGDFVLGLNGINKVVGYDRPMLIIDNIREGNLYGFNGLEKFITSEHPVMTKQGWKAIDQFNAVRVDPHLDKILIGNLNIGDEVMCEDGSYITINSIEKYEDQPQQELYNLLLDGDHTFYVNDLLVHNKGDGTSPGTAGGGE